MKQINKMEYSRDGDHYELQQRRLSIGEMVNEDESMRDNEIEEMMYEYDNSISATEHETSDLNLSWLYESEHEWFEEVNPPWPNCEEFEENCGCCENHLECFVWTIRIYTYDEASKKEVFERLAEARIGGGDTLGRGHA